MANVTNQDLGLTSTTTGGQAQTMGATDVNLDPAKSNPAPFPNQAPNGNATTHSTSKTQVQSGPVLRQGDKVGPTSNPAHPNTGGGAAAAGNPYRQEAEGQKGSPNIRVEGKPPTRLTDPTTQNRCNTTGQFAEAAPTGATPGATGAPKEACHILEVSIECQHGRKQGPDKLLEVLAAGGGELAEVVTLKAKRIDARTKGNPTCEPKTHTKWLFEKTGGRVPAKKETIVARDQYELRGDWLTYGPEVQVKGNIGLREGGAQMIKRDFLEGVLADKNAKRAAEGRKPLPMKKLGNSYRTRANEEVAYQKWNTNNLSRAHAVVGKAVEFGTLLEVLFARKFAPTIAVKAEACSGAQDFKVRVFPNFKAEASITPEAPEIKAIKATTASLEKLLKVFKKIGSMAGLSIDAGVSICEGGGVFFSAMWEEMPGDKPELNLYKHHCDVAAEVSFGFETLIGIKFNVGVPLVAFANVFIPGSGSALASALNWLGVEATIGVDTEFGFSPMVKLEKKAGDALTDISCGLSFDLVFKLFFNVKIKWGSSVEVAGGVLISGSPSVSDVNPRWPLPQVAIEIDDGEIKVGFRGYAKVDVLWWEINEEINYYPEACQIRYKKFPLKPFAWMSSDQ